MRDGIVNPLKATIYRLYNQRIVWLLALVFVNIFSATAIKHFENVVQSVVSLVSAFQAPEVMPVVALAMILTVIGGSLLGMLLPFVLTKFKVEPATASAPLITSLCDIMGVLIYLSLANWYFGMN